MRTNKDATILDLLERLLDKGAVVKGDVLLSVADVDLVYLNLELLLSSMATLRKEMENAMEIKDGNQKIEKMPNLETEKVEDRKEIKINGAMNFDDKRTTGQKMLIPTPARLTKQSSLEKPVQRTDVNPKNIEKGLTKLVLALVNLLRKLMEQQALRKIELGYVNNDEIERMGNSFMLLDKKIEELRITFGLKEEDLNLNLGPLGDLY